MASSVVFSFYHETFIMKRFLKKSILSAEKTFGLFRKNREKNKSRLLVLCYHGVVSDNSPVNSRTHICVSESEFEKQVALLRDQWNPVSLTEIEAACLGKNHLPDYAVHVTFDDGYRNNCTLAAPILKKYDVPAVVFLTTGLIGGQTPPWPQEIKERLIDGTGEVFPIPLSEDQPLPDKSFVPTPDNRIRHIELAHEVVLTCRRLSQEKRLEYLERLRSLMTFPVVESWKKELYEMMSWNEARKILEYGVDLGSHTVSHPILTALSESDLHRELSESKKKMEIELGEECFSIAYPNGGRADVNEIVIREAEKIGYHVGFNLFDQRNPPTLNPMSIDRFCVSRDIGFLEFEKMLTRS